MKRLVVLAVFTALCSVALATLLTPAAEAAGPQLCWYQCGCNGIPEWCCATSRGIACKPALGAPIACPQIADC